MAKLDKGKVERALLDCGLSTKRIVGISKELLQRDLFEDETPAKKFTRKDIAEVKSE